MPAWKQRLPVELPSIFYNDVYVRFKAVGHPFSLSDVELGEA